MPTYSYSVQYAEFDFDDVDEKGIVSPEQILAAFDAFDWAGQIESANQLEKCSPTFSVRDLDENRLFWVSGYGSPTTPRFVNEYAYQGEVTRLFGFIRRRGTVSPQSRELDLAEARKGIQLFVAARHRELLDLLTS